ncbi:MAG: hypothetical protein Q9199_008083 [Rusavskia elegans]
MKEDTGSDDGPKAGGYLSHGQANTGIDRSSERLYQSSASIFAGWMTESKKDHTKNSSKLKKTARTATEPAMLHMQPTRCLPFMRGLLTTQITAATARKEGKRTQKGSHTAHLLGLICNDEQL